MDWKQLFSMQKELDDRIESEHNLVEEDLFQKKVLALFVELGELANETRCFKFWSHKKASAISVILEEYVDVLHFIMSIGIEKGISFQGTHIHEESDQELTGLFHEVIALVHKYNLAPNEESYCELFHAFLTLGVELGFTEKDIQDAYFEKNKVNHLRQEEGY